MRENSAAADIELSAADLRASPILAPRPATDHWALNWLLTAKITKHTRFGD